MAGYGAASGVLGRVVTDIDLGDDIEVAVVAAIRDNTPEVVEDPASEGCRPGNRLVIAANRDRIDQLATYLSG
jgi:hypothetical protein